MTRPDDGARGRSDTAPNATDATDPDVGQLRERFAEPGSDGSLEKDRAREAIHAKLFGFSDGPVQVGRFVLGERLGAGAMGIVYAAIDPRLDRKVAVKVLHPQTDPGQREENVARLLREAKTLARLTHPNVVAVHEVGETDDGLFIAMQFVDGSNLGAWLASHPRPWANVLRLFMGAGAGLAAAHRQELVHRDFKPDNVLVDADDHPRVADFGLACSVLEADRTLETDDSGELLRVTQTGAVVGTPAYMAPELFDGHPADALSDQYAFCVALYEALYGVRPFAGKTVAAFTDNARSMQLTAPEKGRDAPTWLRRAVLRGLDPDARRRFVNMDALLSALERGVHRRRRMLTVGLAGVAGLSALTAVASYSTGGEQETAACPAADALVRSLWSDGDRERLTAAFDAEERAYVADFGDRTLEQLDSWATTWADARVDACKATHERAEQSAELLELRVECYELAAAKTRAVVGAMANDTDALDNAPAIASRLPDLRVCADRQWVRDRRPLPRGADARERVEALSQSVARAQLLQYGGNIDEALAIATEARAEADRLEYPPLATEALRLAAAAHSAAGKPGLAETTLAEALTESLAGGDEWGAAMAAIRLIEYVSKDGKRKDERERWTTVAQGIITKLGSPADLEGELALTQATALRVEGDAEGARDAAKRALTHYTEFYGERDARTAHAHEELGIALDMLGHPDEGIVHVERSLEIERSVWGADHPRAGASLINLGILNAQRGDIDACAALFEEGLGVIERAYGPDSIMIVSALTNLGGARELQQRYDEALALNVRARAIRERVHGPDHVEVAVNLANGGGVLTNLERYDEALEWLEAALKIRSEKFGETHPAVAHAHMLIGDIHRAEERFDAAEVHYARAIEAWSISLGAEHPSVGAAMLNLGEVQARAGARSSGLAQMRRGAAIVIAARGEEHPDAEIARQQVIRVETGTP